VKKNCYEGSKCCKCIHILFTTNIIREGKTLWIKEQNAAKWIHGANEIKPQFPPRFTPLVSRPSSFISGLMRYHCRNIPEMIFRYIAALTCVPVQLSRTGYFKLLFQTAVKDMKHSFQSCDRTFIACLTLCRQYSALSILKRCKISRLYRNFVQYVKHKQSVTFFW